MEQHADTPATRGDDRPPMGDLAAVTALAALMQREDDEGTPVQRPGTSTAATSRAWETGRTQAAQAAAIWNSRRETASANLQDPPTALNTDIALKKRLPFVKEFTATGGDLEAFRRRFTAAYKLANWTEEEALRVLPAALDDDGLAAFDAIPGTSPCPDGAHLCSSVPQVPQVRHAQARRG
ncbi:unnamed protein product [Lampetra planeri]